MLYSFFLLGHLFLKEETYTKSINLVRVTRTPQSTRMHSQLVLARVSQSENLGGQF